MSQLVNLKKSYFVAGVIHALRQNSAIENMFATSCVHQIIVAVEFSTASFSCNLRQISREFPLLAVSRHL